MNKALKTIAVVSGILCTVSAAILSCMYFEKVTNQLTAIKNELVAIFHKRIYIGK